MQHRSAIGCNLVKSYKVNTIHKAVISLSSLLEFLLNLIDWSIIEDKEGKEKPTLCQFLIHVLDYLINRQDRIWQTQFKKEKHISLSI